MFSSKKVLCKVPTFLYICLPVFSSKKGFVEGSPNVSAHLSPSLLFEKWFCGRFPQIFFSKTVMWKVPLKFLYICPPVFSSKKVIGRFPSLFFTFVSQSSLVFWDRALWQILHIFLFLANSVSFGAFSHSNGLGAKWHICLLWANGYCFRKGSVEVSANYSLHLFATLLYKSSLRVPPTVLALHLSPSVLLGPKLRTHANPVRRQRPIMSLLLGYSLGLFLGMVGRSLKLKIHFLASTLVPKKLCIQSYSFSLSILIFFRVFVHLDISLYQLIFFCNSWFLPRMFQWPTFGASDGMLNCETCLTDQNTFGSAVRRLPFDMDISPFCWGFMYLNWCTILLSPAKPWIHWEPQFPSNPGRKTQHFVMSSKVDTHNLTFTWSLHLRRTPKKWIGGPNKYWDTLIIKLSVHAICQVNETMFCDQVGRGTPEAVEVGQRLCTKVLPTRAPAPGCVGLAGAIGIPLYSSLMA